MLNWASEEGRQWVIEHGAAVELGLSLGDGPVPPLVFLSPRSGPDADELADLERVLMSMLLAGGHGELVTNCARTRMAFQWRCKLADLARACTHWPHDVAPRVYASADKALTIEINKRKHSPAAQMGAAQREALGAMNAQVDAMKSGTDAVKGGLELAGSALDLAVKKLRVASDLIQAMREDSGRAMRASTIALISQWDKLKGK